MSQTILQLDDIVRVYGGGGWFNRQPVLRAVDGVSLQIAAGETLSIVGESGSGKSTLGRIAAGIEAPTEGRVMFGDAPYATIGSAAWRRERARVQVIWQNPSRALNPRMTIAAQVEEAMAAHERLAGAARSRRVDELLDLVGLAGLGQRYVHQLSGGQQQRAVIARALSLEPQLVVCDEAVSALDVSVQAQIINLLNDLKQQFAISYLFISHDLGVVKHVSDRIAVMQRGQIVEVGDARTLFVHAKHPYTQALLAAAPAATPAERRAREAARKTSYAQPA